VIVNLIRATPAWLLDHPWIVAGVLVGVLALLTSLILLNPNGRQLRDLRRKR
jgi:hypothetical protein